MKQVISVISEFKKALYDTALSAGIQIISDDKCCQLMAYLLVYGGVNEQVVVEGRISSAMLYAQKRLNLLGGETPNAELLPVLQGYIKSLGGERASNEQFENPPDWVVELEKEYGIKAHYRRTT